MGFPSHNTVYYCKAIPIVLQKQNKTKPIHTNGFRELPAFLISIKSTVRRIVKMRTCTSKFARRLLFQTILSSFCLSYTGGSWRTYQNLCNDSIPPYVIYGQLFEHAGFIFLLRPHKIIVGSGI